MVTDTQWDNIFLHLIRVSTQSLLTPGGELGRKYCLKAPFRCAHLVDVVGQAGRARAGLARSNRDDVLSQGRRQDRPRAVDGIALKEQERCTTVVGVHICFCNTASAVLLLDTDRAVPNRPSQKRHGNNKNRLLRNMACAPDATMETVSLLGAVIPGSCTVKSRRRSCQRQRR